MNRPVSPRPYVTDKSKLLTASNAHFDECRQSGLPFISVHRRGRFAKVGVDMITTNCQLDVGTQNLLKDVLLKNSHPNTEWSISELECKSTKVYAEHAETTAQEVHAITMRAMPRLAHYINC